MSDDKSGADIRSVDFKVARRGYDIAEVDAFQEEVASRIDALHDRVGALEVRIGQLDVADPAAMKDELETVVADVARVLEAAREAADGMRDRASADSSRWRADADRDARRVRAEAQDDGEALRGSAWEAASEMLEAARTEAEEAFAAARQEALFMRAEAEREALRLTGDARRDGEEELRLARSRAERLLAEGKVESDTILEAARQSAESAQERALALEKRRSVLMEELEAARLSIGKLEQEMEARREELQFAAEATDSGVRVIPSSADPSAESAEWLDDERSVRIVPAVPGPAFSEEIDSDAFVAEVEQLHAATSSRARSPVAAPVPVEAPAEADVDVPEEPDENGTDQGVSPAADDAKSDEPADGETAVEDVAVAESDAVTDEPPDDVFRDLFASLRQPELVEPSREPPSPADKTELDHPDTAPESDIGAPPPRSNHRGDEVEPETVATRPTAFDGRDPFELRERLVLPIENRCLRSLKRRIVDLQNRVLEELRVGETEWAPDRALVTAAIRDDVVDLTQESFVAGYAGAAELVGVDATPRPEGGPGHDVSSEMVDAMVAGLEEALGRARSGNGGPRQLSAAASRVFRAWRTDEAARHLRRAAFGAYHEGMLAAYPDVGVTRVVCIAPGRPCGECPAESRAEWMPGQRLPAGTAMPPATANCEGTIVPAYREISRRPTVVSVP